MVGGTVTELSLDPRALDIATVELSALQGGDAQVNARIAGELFDGRTGPVRDAVLLNAAGAIVAFEQTEPFTEETFAGAGRRSGPGRRGRRFRSLAGRARSLGALSTELGAAKNPEELGLRV